jgi:hypothetical protein
VHTHRFLPQHVAPFVELFAGETQLEAKVGTFVISLGVFDTGPLYRLGGFSPVLEWSQP